MIEGTKIDHGDMWGFTMDPHPHGIKFYCYYSGRYDVCACGSIKGR